MSDQHDDTTPPFAGHGFACSEQYPLNASSRIEALERQIDLLTDQMAARTNRIDQMTTELMRCRDALDVCRARVRVLPNAGDVVELVDSLIGPDVLSRIGGERAS